MSGQASREDNYASSTTGDYQSQASFNALPAKHAGDELFIGKLTTPGTVWRWKEDPDQILYVTVVNNDFSTGPYTQDEWKKENNGDLDDENGVYLFNYAMFADYYLKPHHKESISYTCFGSQSNSDEKWDFVSRKIENENHPCSAWCACAFAAWATVAGYCSPWRHNEPASKYHGQAGWDTPHKRFPTGIYDWDHQVNKRRRFAFKSEVYKDMNGAEKGGPLGSGDHKYLPTNDPSLPAHFDATGTAITAYPTGHAQAGITFASQNLIAPGIRNDGMHVGYDNPGGDWDWDPDGNGLYVNPTTSVQGYEDIPM